MQEGFDAPVFGQCRDGGALPEVHVGQVVLTLPVASEIGGHLAAGCGEPLCRDDSVEGDEPAPVEVRLGVAEMTLQCRRHRPVVARTVRFDHLQSNTRKGVALFTLASFTFRRTVDLSHVMDAGYFSRLLMRASIADIPRSRSGLISAARPSSL